MPWSTVHFARTDTRVTAIGTYSSKAARALESVGFRRESAAADHYHPASRERQEPIIRRALDALAKVGITHPHHEASLDRLVTAIPTAEDVHELGVLVEAVALHQDTHLEETIDAAGEALRGLDPDAVHLADDLDDILSQIEQATNSLLTVAETLRRQPPPTRNPGRSAPPGPAPLPPPAPPNDPPARGR